MLKKILLTRFNFFILFLCCQFYVIGGELDVGYDSRYVSEGRNNLGQDGISWFQLSQELNSSWSMVGLYGNSNKYDELNLSLVYATSYAQIDYYLSYTRLEFFKDNAADNELGFGAAYTFSAPFTVAVDSTYSTQANGFFAEVSLSSAVMLNKDVSINPYVKAGFDFGYASENKKAFNHTSLGATANFRHSSDLSFYLIIERAIASSQVKNETGEKHQDWLGVHFVYAY